MESLRVAGARSATAIDGSPPRSRAARRSATNRSSESLVAMTCGGRGPRRRQALVLAAFAQSGAVTVTHPTGQQTRGGPY
jgi:hypothetical protein